MLVVVLYSEREQWRFIAAITVVAVALATDFLDGALARRFGLESKHGYILDGLGDRAMYIGLFLAFLTQRKIGLLATWLLIFREVAIYATRLLSSQWFEVNKSVRFLSRLHAALLRMWILSVLAGDAASLYAGFDSDRIRAFQLAQSSLLFTALLIAYYSLLRHLGAILATVDL
jgi:phosphatidylglycerophosphate synthase